MGKISYEKLSQLQKLILVALSEPRYAVMKRPAFNRLVKRLYYGKDGRVATSSLSRAYQRLEDRQYIVRFGGLEAYRQQSCAKDKEVLFNFYDFPAQHWPHLRTTNPIESTFATVRLRTHRTKGSGSRIATLTMVFKLGMEAQKRWRRLNGAELVAKVVSGVTFVDGEEQTQQAA